MGYVVKQALLIALLLSTCGPRMSAADDAHEPAAVASQTIQVVAEGTDRGVPGATVRLYRSGDATYFPGRLYHPQAPISTYTSDETGSVDLVGIDLPTMATIRAKGFGTQVRMILKGTRTVRLGQPTGLSGAVVSSQTGRPVVGAEVTSFAPLSGVADIGGHPHVTSVGDSGGTARTDSEGHFRIMDGGHSRLLRIRAEGFATLWRGVLDLRSKPDAKLRLALRPEGAMQGRVLREDGTPAARVLVYAHAVRRNEQFDLRLHAGAAYLQGVNALFAEVLRGHGERGLEAICPSSVKTDQNGRFRLSRLDVQTEHVVWATSDNGNHVSPVYRATPQSPRGQGDTVVLQLARAASISIQVRRPSGEAVERASVGLQPIPHGAWGYLRDVDGTGAVSFDTVVPGTYRPVVTVGKSGTRTEGQVIRVQAGKRTSSTITLTR